MSKWFGKGSGMLLGSTSRYPRCRRIIRTMHWNPRLVEQVIAPAGLLLVRLTATSVAKRGIYYSLCLQSLRRTSLWLFDIDVIIDASGHPTGTRTPICSLRDCRPRPVRRWDDIWLLGFPFGRIARFRFKVRSVIRTCVDSLHKGGPGAFAQPKIKSLF